MQATLPKAELILSTITIDEDIPFHNTLALVELILIKSKFSIAHKNYFPECNL